MSYIIYPLFLIFILVSATLCIVFNLDLDIGFACITSTISVFAILLEKIFVYRKDWYVSKHDTYVDVLYILSDTFINNITRSLMFVFIAYIASLDLPKLSVLSEIPFIFAISTGVLIGEFFPYLYHRYCHKGNQNSKVSMFFWRVHSIHHIPQKVYWLNNFRLHPIDVCFNTLGTLFPIMLLGANQEVLFCVGLLSTMHGFLGHANINIKLGFLNYILLGPDLHRYHHSKITSEALNFGTTFTLFDILFRTFYYPKNKEVSSVGVMEPLSYPMENKFNKQILFPFFFEKYVAKRSF